jgi:hypothetical protein
MTDVGAPAPEVYRLSMEKLPLAVGRARRVMVVQALLIVTAIVAGFSLLLRGTGAGTDVGLVLWGLAVLTLPYAIWRAGLRVRRRWNAFELSIGPTSLRCAARGAGRVTMRLDEIASITEGASGLVVRTRDDVIRIPLTVEGFLDVRARLAGVRAISRRADALGWCAALLLAGVLAFLTSPVWGRVGCIALGVIACQAAAVAAAGVEVRWHPRLPRAGKLAALAALAVAAALPVVSLLAPELVP